MTYLATFTVPVAYQADDDNHARVIAEHIDDVLANASLPHGAKVMDEAQGYVLEQTQPGGHPSRIVVGEDDFVARYAPFPVTTGQGHPPCPVCADYIASSHTPAGDSGLSVETIDDV